MSFAGFGSQIPAYVLAEAKETSTACLCKQALWGNYEGGRRSIPIPNWWLLKMKNGRTIARSTVGNIRDMTLPLCSNRARFCLINSISSSSAAHTRAPMCTPRRCHLCARCGVSQYFAALLQLKCGYETRPTLSAQRKAKDSRRQKKARDRRD